MPITVQHQPAAAAVGNIALEAGRGDFGRFVTQNQQANANRTTQARQFQASLDAQAAGRQFQSDQAVASRDFAVDQQGRQSNIRMAEAQLNSERALQDRADLYELDWTTEQQREADKLAKGMTWVESSDMSPYQKSQARIELNRRFAGLTPQPKLRQKAPFPEGTGIGEVWENAHTGSGVWMTRDDKGVVKNLYDENAIQIKQQQAQAKMAADLKQKDDERAFKRSVEMLKIRATMAKATKEIQLDDRFDANDKPIMVKVPVYTDAQIDAHIAQAFGPQGAQEAAPDPGAPPRAGFEVGEIHPTKGGSRVRIVGFDADGTPMVVPVEEL